MSSCQSRGNTDEILLWSCSQKKTGGKTSDIYYKNSLINTSGAINTTYRISIEILRDKEFKMANRALDGLLKERMRSGTSLPTIQLQRNFWTSWSSFFFSYLKKGSSSPVILRRKIWFLTSILFPPRAGIPPSTPLKILRIQEWWKWEVCNFITWDTAKNIFMVESDV